MKDAAPRENCHCFRRLFMNYRTIKDITLYKGGNQ